MNLCRHCDQPVGWDDVTCPHCGQDHPNIIDEAVLERRERKRRHEREMERRHGIRRDLGFYKHPAMRLLMPRFDRHALFLMAVSFLLIFISTPEVRKAIFMPFFGETRILSPGILVVFAMGILFALVSAVCGGRLRLHQRQAMLFFACVVNTGSGIAGSVLLLKESHGWLLLFPIWNLINCALFIALFIACREDDRFYRAAIIDERPEKWQVAVGYAAVFLVFGFSAGVFELHWSATFCICVAMATNLNALLVWLVKAASGKGASSQQGTS